MKLTFVNNNVIKMHGNFENWKKLTYKKSHYAMNKK